MDNLTIKEINKKMEISRRKIYALGSLLNVDISNLKLNSLQPEDINNNNNELDIKTHNSELEIEKQHFNELKHLLLKKIEQMELSNEELIVFLKDDLGWKWKEIQKVEVLSYSKRQLQRKYNKTKRCHTMSP